MIARFLPAANGPIDSGAAKPWGQRAIQQQVIDSQARIASICISEVIPKRIDSLPRMKRSNRVCPSLLEQLTISSSRLWSKQRIVHPPFRFVDVNFSRHHVVIAGEDDGCFSAHEF